MRTILALVLLVATVAFAGAAVDPGTSTEDRISEHFAEGVKEYYLGNYDKAATALLTGIKLKPGDRQCYDFYLSIGQIKYIKMMERKELAGVLKYILRRANIYRTALRRDPRYIKLLIAKLESEVQKQRVVAQHELVAIGPVAVPYLVQNLVGEDRKDDLRVICRVTLTKIGYRAVVPLIVCLKSNDRRVIETAATSLTDIADPRALPRLKAMIESGETDEVVKSVCENAIAGIKERAGLAKVSTAAQLYWEEASRYFRDAAGVKDESLANEYLIWRWDAEQAPNLIYHVVPRYAWNELMAEQCLLDGMKAYPEYDAYFSMMAAVLEAQWVETYWRERLMKDRTTPPEHPDEELANIELRKKALAVEGEVGGLGPEIEDRVVAVGAVNLYRAVTHAIAAERYDVARRLMHHLRDEWLSQAEALLPSKEEGLKTDKPGTTLVAALQHHERTVRYEAAITLATLDPKLEFFNAEAVIPLLSEAVTEWGMRVVLVVEPDYRERNAARKALQDKNYLVITAADGFEAMARLRESPIKDAIIIAGDLTPFLKDGQDQIIKVPEQNAKGLVGLLRGKLMKEKIGEGEVAGELEMVQSPAYINENTAIFVSLPPDQEVAVAIQNELAQPVEKGGIHGLYSGFVNKPYQSVELAGAIDMAIKDADLPQLNAQLREEVSLAAAQALLAIDPVKTQYQLAAAGDALVRNAVLNRSDAIKATSLLALGRTGRTDLLNKVTDAWTQYKELMAGPEKAEVRRAFVNCIGMLDPTTDAAIAILREAVDDPSRVVRHEAFLALGRGKAVPNTTLLRFLEEKRLDVLNPGAGPDTATAEVEGANVPAEPEATDGEAEAVE